MEVFRALLEGSGIKNPDVKDLGNAMRRLRIALSLKKDVNNSQRFPKLNKEIILFYLSWWWDRAKNKDGVACRAVACSCAADQSCSRAVCAFDIVQKQPPEALCNKRHSYKFCKIHWIKETLAQVFPCEFCEISKNTFFTKHLRATASDLIKDYMKKSSHEN